MAASANVGAQAIVAFDIGLRLSAQVQRLGGVDGWAVGLTVDQAVQDVQHMGLGRDALGQGKFDGGQNRLLVVMQDQGQDIDHLAITASPPQHLLLQSFEGRGQLGKRGSVAQGAGLALDDGEVMPPVVDRAGWQVVRPLDHPPMLA